MNRPTSLLLLLALAGPMLAQPAPEPDAQERAAGAERSRIAAARDKAEADFAAAQKACYQKFAVTGCIEDARERRRDTLADLRRQEVALNDAQRRARAAEQMRTLEAKQADQERKAREAGAQAPDKQAARDRRQADKVAKPRLDAEAAKGRVRAPREKDAAKVPDVEANRARQERRAAEAQEHRAQVQRRAASAKKDLKPLPVPD